MSWRYILSIFPFLAIQIAQRLNEKQLKLLYIFCLLILLFWSINIPKYSFNQLDIAIEPICKEVKTKIDYEPVYVNAFHNWYVIYKCDLNATIQDDSKWTLDFEKGQLYLTNITKG